ncbi:NYN domain-containing protein [Liberiplasma polymorphum]|uniref:NYN domain-containing protein n=1 Tax=Liberiplasma polymorphum TaxID=3374570 RepID=UPI0037714166
MNIDKTIALLIDAENISPKYIELIIDQANKYGKINYRRVYGDWTTDQLGAWKNKINEFGLTPVQQYAYTSGKNVSDFTLIIDAMDILYSGKVDSFCIVTSDSDFTKLVTRLREDNMFVIGMGESKTPISLVNSCEAFSYLDIMFNETEEDTKDVVKKETAKPKKKAPPKNGKSETSITPLKKIKKELKQIIEDNIEEDGYAYWSVVAQLLQKKFPGFHPRNYGHKLRPLNFVESLNEFEIKKDKTVIFIKNVSE